MKTPLEMAQLRFRIAVQQALTSGVGAEQLRIITDEECRNEVDYGVDYEVDQRPSPSSPPSSSPSSSLSPSPSPSLPLPPVE